MCCYTPGEGRPWSVAARNSSPNRHSSSELLLDESNFAQDNGRDPSTDSGRAWDVDHQIAQRHKAVDVDYDPNPPPNKQLGVILDTTSISTCLPEQDQGNNSSASHPPLVSAAHLNDWSSNNNWPVLGTDTPEGSLHEIRADLLAHRATESTNDEGSILSFPPLAKGVPSSTGECKFPKAAAENSRQPFHGKVYLSPSFHHTLLYGFDAGKPDLDRLDSNDSDMITNFLVPERVSVLPYCDLLETEVQIGLQDELLQNKGDIFYSLPTPIRIPTSLVPLPDMLLSVPANLLYFHHFMSKTAIVLAARYRFQNPFKDILVPCKLASLEHVAPS